MARRTWKDALKEAAVKLVREAERLVGANDAAPCAGCGHPRSQHCGCGMHCIGSGTPCECGGFTPKLEEDPRDDAV